MARSLLLDLDLKLNGGRHRFYEAVDMREFAARERLAWQEVVEDDWGTPPFNSLSKRLTQLEQATPGNDTPSESEVGAFRDTALTIYLGDQRIPHSTSADYALVKELAAEEGLDVARGALALTMPWAAFQNIVVQSPNAMIGAMAMAIAKVGVSRAASSAMVKRLNGYVARREDQLARERRALDEFFFDQTRTIAELENEQRDRLADFQRAQADDENAFRNQTVALHSEGERVIGQILATDALFRQQMQLKAPSEYWETKGAEHKQRAKDLRGWIGGSTIVGAVVYGLVLGFGFGPITAFLTSFADKPAALFIITGAAAFILAIPLWFLRILVKFYLSEQHLAADANERQTMALTYLALANDGKVDEKDRSLVLGALFRSGSDGLVKDAAGPDASVAGLISRLLEK